MTLRTRTVGLLLALGLFASACGSGEPSFSTTGSIDDAAVPIAPNSETLTACAFDVDESLPASTSEGPNGISLSFDQDQYQPGNTATFNVGVPDGYDSGTGDDWFIECFDGEQWKPAWVANQVFSAQSSFQYWENGGTTDDELSFADGSIVIPPDAPHGMYRVNERVWLYDAVQANDPNAASVDELVVTLEVVFYVGDPAPQVDVVDDASDAVSGDSAAREFLTGPLNSGVLSRCGFDSSDEVVSLEAQVGIPEGVEFFVTNDVSPQGGVVEFDWVIPDGLEGTTGDEWVVECWNGEQWTNAWMALSVYGPNPRPTSLDREVFVTDDGYGLNRGQVPIPADAPLGSYRLTHAVFLYDPLGGNQTRVDLEVQFTVTARN